MVKKKKKEAEKLSSRMPVAGEELSDHEIDVWHLIACELDHQEIAHELGLGVATVHSHIRRLMRKLNVFTAAGLAKLAVMQSLVDGSVLRYGERAGCAGAHKVTVIGRERSGVRPERYFSRFGGEIWLK